MADDRQLALPFDHPPSMAGDDFLVASCNREAVTWLECWPRWPAPVLVLHGPRGCGKSHLLTAFATRTGAERWMQAGEAGQRDWFGEADGSVLPPLAIDDGPRVLAALGERAFLHLYNWRLERGGTLLMTAHHPPARWPIALPDLRSRLAAAFAIGILEPDDGILRAMMAKLFRDRNVMVDDPLLDYLIARSERSFAAAADLVAALDSASLRLKRPVTVSLAHRVLAAEGESAVSQAGPLLQDVASD